MNDPFGRPSRPPGDFTREGRVRLLAEVFEDLLAGRQPSREAAAFLGGAGAAWLAQGGDLVKDYLRVTKQGSHHTPQHLAAKLRGNASSSPMSDSADGTADHGAI